MNRSDPPGNLPSMKLTDLNSARDIGANCLYVEIGPFRMVVDCGLHPKHTGRDALPNFGLIEDGLLDFILITHCHLDHLGALPVLFRHQPQALVLMSQGSQIIAARMLRNSCNVMKRQRDELNIREYPLFTMGEIDELEPKIMGLAFNHPKRFSGPDGQEIEITFYPAGHVAGAAGILLVYKRRRIFFSGDVQFANQYTLDGAAFPTQKLDTLVMETTRGQTERPEDFDRESEAQRLVQQVGATIEGGGSVLIPAFALGRMQEILSILHQGRRNRMIPECPIYASGLGMDLMDYFDTISRKTGALRFRRQILQELGVRSLRQKFVPGRGSGESAIYVLSSGMLVENTPSYACAAALVEDPANAICFVGYCDPDTPGGRFQQYAQGETFPFDAVDFHGRIRAHVEKYDLSGHADREALMQYALSVDPRAVVLTHGDPDSRDWFLDEFAIEGGNRTVIDPEPGKSYLV